VSASTRRAASRGRRFLIAVAPASSFTIAPLLTMSVSGIGRSLATAREMEAAAGDQRNLDPRACASTIASRFASGRRTRLSSSVPSMSMARRRITVDRL
jgi:hypothetical protein